MFHSFIISIFFHPLRKSLAFDYVLTLIQLYIEITEITTV